MTIIVLQKFSIDCCNFYPVTLSADTLLFPDK